MYLQKILLGLDYVRDRHKLPYTRCNGSNLLGFPTNSDLRLMIVEIGVTDVKLQPKNASARINFESRLREG